VGTHPDHLLAKNAGPGKKVLSYGYPALQTHEKEK